MHKNKILSVVSALTMAIVIVAYPISASAMTLPELDSEYAQYHIYANADDPFAETGLGILRFGSGSQGTTVNSISVNTTARTITFEGLTTTRMDVDEVGWSLIFNGTNSINTELVNESSSDPLSLTVLPNSTLRIGTVAYGLYELGPNTVSSKTFETESSTHTGTTYEWNDELGELEEVPFEYESIETEGPIVLSNSNSSNSTDESSAPGEGSDDSASSTPPVVQNSTVELGDGVSLESVLPGSYSSILPVAVQTPGALVGRLIEAGDVLPAPANFRDYSATVSEFNSTDSPASAAVIDTYAEATGQDVIGIMNINLVDGSAASPAPGAGLDIRDANSATEGSILFPVFSNGEASWACADGAAAIVVGLGGTAAALRTVSICGVTEGGGVFIQPDLDKNPQTATFYAFRGNAAYGICQDSIAPAETGNSVQTNRVITNSISPVITPSSSLPLAAAPGKTMAVYAIEGSDALGLPRYIDGDRVFWTVRHF